MWKKDEKPEEVPQTRSEGSPAPDRPTRSRTAAEPAIIGRSITIRGEVTGDEDLLVQGRVDGSVGLEQNAVTVGSEGHVKGDVTGRTVTVEGLVHGNLTAKERIVLRGSARVEGDLSAPRVVLEDGARFRGGVDMGEEPGRQRAAAPTSSPGSAGTRPPPAPTPQPTAGASGADEKSAAKDPAASGSKSPVAERPAGAKS